jgi:LytS/YehU family sensor histidine kinase
MLLQPLVENAIRHGVATRTVASRVDVSAHVERGVLRLSVKDAAETELPSEIGAQPGEGVGLANTRERLNTLYGSAARLTLHELPGRGTEVVVELPFRTDAEE